MTLAAASVIMRELTYVKWGDWQLSRILFWNAICMLNTESDPSNISYKSFRT
jgi:hypothetical protein